MRVAALALVLVGTALPVGADGADHLEFDRPEAWADAFVTTTTLMGPLGAPAARRVGRVGRVELGFETGSVPHVSTADRRVGFDGFKEEKMNRTAVFGRIRATIGLPRGITLELGAIPPVEIDGATPEFYSLSIARPLADFGRGGRLGLRVHGQHGTVEADITCSAEAAAAGNDPQANPFGCDEPSNDELTTDYAGVELSHAWPLRDGRLEPYVAVSLNRMELEFAVRARYFGSTDETRQRTDGATVAAIAGVGWRGRGRLGAAAEVLYSPLRVRRPPATTSSAESFLNLRAMLRWTLR